MKELINQHYAPITLASGTVLAAAGTEGSVRHVESISDGDQRRYADRGLIAVRDVEFESTAPTEDRRPSTAGEAAAPKAAARPADNKESK